MCAGVVAGLEQNLGAEPADATQDMGGEQIIHPAAVCQTRRNGPGNSALYLEQPRARRQGLLAGAVAGHPAGLPAWRLEILHQSVRSLNSDFETDFTSGVVAARPGALPENHAFSHLHDRDLFDVADRAEYRHRRAQCAAGLSQRWPCAETVSEQDGL